MSHLMKQQRKSIDLLTIKTKFMNRKEAIATFVGPQGYPS